MAGHFKSDLSLTENPVPRNFSFQSHILNGLFLNIKAPNGFPDREFNFRSRVGQ